ncbi:transposase [Pseudomonas sp. CDFA 611]|nr:transposase [Pseudomonas quasicaspiana]
MRQAPEMLFCRSELARDSGVSVNTLSDWKNQSRASSLLQRDASTVFMATPSQPHR